MSSTPNNRYDSDFEGRVEKFRRRKQALVANNLPFACREEDFENACRAKLTQPETVQFHWARSLDARYQHRGWVMLCFSNRPALQTAWDQIQGMNFDGRLVNFKKADRHARLPRARRQDEPTAAPPAPSGVSRSTPVPAPVAGSASEEADPLGNTYPVRDQEPAPADANAAASPSIPGPTKPASKAADDKGENDWVRDDSDGSESYYDPDANTHKEPRDL